MTQPDVLVAGYALIDLVPSPAGPVAMPGGSPFNVALALGRLRRSAAFLGCFGDDAHGRSLARILGDAGVDLSGAARVERPTPVVHVETDAAGQPAYRFALAGTAFEEPLPWPADWPQRAHHLHVGSTTALDDRHGPGVLAALTHARGRLTVSFDPNIRPALLPPRAGTARRVEERVAAADWVKASVEDLAWLYPDEAPEAVAARWLRAGPSLVVLTRGAEGASAWSAHASVSCPAPAVPVADTVGAGDTLMAALIDGLLAREGATLDGPLLGEVLARAVRAASLVCTRAGCDPPTAEELAAFTVSRGT